MLKGIVQSIEGDQITVALSDGQTLRVPVSSIEGAPVSGGEIFLLPFVTGGEAASRSQFARDLLNHLLKG